MVMELIGVKYDLRRGIRNVQNSTQKNLKRDRNLDTFSSRLSYKFKVFSTFKESGYLMEPLGVKDDLRGIRDVHTTRKLCNN